ncbi:glycosyltransferase family 4 protein [Ochrobactrum sp. 3-3]|uniref:glycosyltransferase family 4 protein n=1 Tax=Ochrobactrum sp. 3-3 TaxID=1830124 RepID=UPI0013B40DC1|nr:glycosyltransferase family 4 protein [Ochrobactrum sp. 3-3]
MQGVSAKNILVVTEFFVGGGLETQLYGQARYLQAQGYKVHLVTGSSRNDLAASVFDSTYFDVPMAKATALELLGTIDLLGDIIEKKGVNLIHCHPFYSIVPAMFAADKYSLPLVSTIHGPASLSSERDTVLGLFLFDLLLPRASMLLSVSLEAAIEAKKISPCNPLLLPNAVEFPVGEFSPLDLRQPWLWAGRLDDAKTVGLLALIHEFHKHKHNVLHIYGAGSTEDSVRKVLQKLDPDGIRLQYMGWKDNISDVIQDYSVICGMGRVLLEGASRNRPCMLVGYDGIKGLLSQENLAFAESFNFSGRGMHNISSDAFGEQVMDLDVALERYSIGEALKKSHTESEVWDRYQQLTDTITPFSCEVLRDFRDLLWLSSGEVGGIWSNPRVYAGFKSLLHNAKELN